MLAWAVGDPAWHLNPLAKWFLMALLVLPACFAVSRVLRAVPLVRRVFS